MRIDGYDIQYTNIFVSIMKSLSMMNYILICNLGTEMKRTKCKTMTSNIFFQLAIGTGLIIDDA